MDKAEKVHYEDQINKYVELNKLPDYFELLTKQLLIHQPEDPLQYLVEFLQYRRAPRIIFITGTVQDKRREIAQACSNYMNYKDIGVEDLFAGQDLNQVSDDALNEAVYKAIQTSEKHYRGYIISGYPNNFRQATYIQQKGILAERIYVLKFSEEDCLSHFKQYYTEERLLENSMKLEQINEKELKERYDSYYDEFDLQQKSKDEIIDIMKSQLKLKDQRNVPLRSPRVVLITPPHLKKRSNEIYSILIEKYGFHPVSLDKLVDYQIEKQTEVGKYLQRNNKIKHDIPHDISTTLVRTEMTKPVARQKGWILEGYPSNQEQLGVFKSYKINPNLVIILDDDEDQFKEQYSKMMIDPLFQKRYEAGLEDIDPVTQARLVEDKTQEYEWNEIIAQYRQFVKEVEAQFENHTQRFRMSKETTEKIIKSIDVFINNPKIYS